MHDIELALGALQIALYLGLRDAIEITKRLEHVDGQTQVVAKLAYFGRRAGVLQQVVFKDLDAIKMGRCCSPQFFAQHAGQRDGSDSVFHILAFRGMEVRRPGWAQWTDPALAEPARAAVSSGVSKIKEVFAIGPAAPM